MGVYNLENHMKALHRNGPYKHTMLWSEYTELALFWLRGKTGTTKQNFFKVDSYTKSFWSTHTQRNICVCSLKLQSICDIHNYITDDVLIFDSVYMTCRYVWQTESRPTYFIVISLSHLPHIRYSTRLVNKTTEALLTPRCCWVRGMGSYARL